MLITLDVRGHLHSKRVGKMSIYTRNEWRRCKNTLETSGEDVKLHSKRVYFSCDFTPATTSFIWGLPHFNFRKSRRGYNGRGWPWSTKKCNLSTRFECRFASCSLVSSVFSSFPLVPSVVLRIFHSFRVYFPIFFTRFERSFASFPLGSSVV